MTLKFSPANAKTVALKVVFKDTYLKEKRKVYSLDLSSGVSCPGAKDCKSMAVIDPLTGRATIKDGPHCQFRCFSASQEVLFPSLRKLREHNFALLKQAKTVDKIASLILNSLPSNAGVVRLHVGGDFFSLNYLLAMYRVAFLRPDILFYFYTKSLHHLKALYALKGIDGVWDLSIGEILPNFLVTASRGGKFDHLIGELGIREAVVVNSEAEAMTLGLTIDHDDSHAAKSGDSFALLLHGTQPAGTPAARALSILKKKGLGSYNRS